MNKPESMVTPGVVANIPLSLIDADPDQPRREFDQGPLEQLAEDILRRGIRFPLELRAAGERYILVDGERRWRAAQMAQLDTVPALLAIEPDSEAPELDRLIHQAASSILREELSVVDKARLYKRLVDEYGIKMGELPDFIRAHNLGEYERSTLSNLIRMLELPDWAVEGIRAHAMPVSASKTLLKLVPFPEAMGEAKKQYDIWVENIDTDGPIREDDVIEMCREAMGDLYIEVRPWSRNAPHYKIEDHADELGVVKIGESTYITNREAHDRLQAEHPKPHPESPAARAPSMHGTPAAPDNPADQTAAGSQRETKPRVDLLEVRNRESINTYLVDWWRLQIARRKGRDDDLIRAVIWWAAAGADRNHAHWGMPADWHAAQAECRKAMKRERLGDFLAKDLVFEDTYAIFEHLLGVLGDAAIVDIVQHFGWKFEDCYVIDAPYLALHNKATLAHTVKQMGAGIVLSGTGKCPPDPKWKACKRLDEMRRYCLDHAEHWRRENRVPKDLAKAWKELVRGVR